MDAIKTTCEANANTLPETPAPQMTTPEEAAAIDVANRATLEAAIAEAKTVCGEASYQHRIAAEQAQPYLEAAQRAAQVLDAAQVRLHGLLEQAKGDVAT